MLKSAVSQRNKMASRRNNFGQVICKNRKRKTVIVMIWLCYAIKDDFLCCFFVQIYYICINKEQANVVIG